MSIYAKIDGVKDGAQSYDQLQINVYYNKDATLSRPRGIYLSLKPVKITNAFGCDLVSTTLYGSDPKVNGLLFLLDELKRKNEKKLIEYTKAYELRKDEIAEYYNKFDKQAIRQLVYSVEV